jgi:hypothetical protein
MTCQVCVTPPCVSRIDNITGCFSQRNELSHSFGFTHQSNPLRGELEEDPFKHRSPYMQPWQIIILHWSSATEWFSLRHRPEVTDVDEIH